MLFFYVKIIRQNAGLLNVAMPSVILPIAIILSEGHSSAEYHSAEWLSAKCDSSK
jgi:hypothetical protein